MIPVVAGSSPVRHLCSVSADPGSASADPGSRRSLKGTACGSLGTPGSLLRLCQPLGRAASPSSRGDTVGSTDAAHALWVVARGGRAGRAHPAARRRHDGRRRHHRGRVPRAVDGMQLKALEPELDVVVLEAGLAGHGPSGRNGGFVSTLWDDLPILRESFGDTRAVEVCNASERGVHRSARGAGRRGRRVVSPCADDATSRPPTRRSGTGTSWSRRARPWGARRGPPLTENEVRDALRLATLPRRRRRAADGGERPAGAARPRAACEGDRQAASGCTSGRAGPS